jgi:membrane protein insertase Oxa1/YidC/SpoIIIJ
VLHEGLIGVIGEEGLQEIDYSDVEDTPVISVAKATAGWMGITDKYWAAALIPPQGSGFETRFAHFTDGRARYQSDFKSDAMAIAPGGSATSTTLVFAGAKEVDHRRLPGQYGILKFELMIDWGWFYFITKPMFWLLDWLYNCSAISAWPSWPRPLIVKLDLLPARQQVLRLDGAHEEVVQPKMQELKEKHGDDREAMQKAMMELYKKEKINPVAGCWPMLIQIPVFFALYKVLYVTIEMRHAPFFGWIQDLSAPDPTHRCSTCSACCPTTVAILPDDRRLAADHGHHHVPADAHEPGAAGPDPGDDLQLDAGGLHLHAGDLPGRSGDLLGVEQHAVDHPAGRHHEEKRRQDRALGQSARHVRPKKRPLDRAEHGHDPTVRMTGNAG